MKIAKRTASYATCHAQFGRAPSKSKNGSKEATKNNRKTRCPFSSWQQSLRQVLNASILCPLAKSFALVCTTSWNGKVIEMNKDVCRVTKSLSCRNKSVAISTKIPRLYLVLSQSMIKAWGEAEVTNANFALHTSALLPLAYTLPIYRFSVCFGLPLRTIDRMHTLKTTPSEG